MLLLDAMQVIANRIAPKGFRVSFERVEGHILASDFFPDRMETPLETEEEAWELATKFSEHTKNKYVNIYVIRAEDFTPVKGYRDRMIENRSWK